MTPAGSIAPGRLALAARPALPWSAGISLAVGFFTPFTVSLVGEMPVGECVLMLVAGWLALCILLNRTWPNDGLREPYFWMLLAAQGLAIAAYVVSDFYRDSAQRDMLRGWARMGFLGIDVVVVAFLVGCHPRNFVWMLVGSGLGDAVSALAFGALFGDIWKFGLALPLTNLALLAAPVLGPLAAVGGAMTMGLVNFGMDFRSLGGLCVLVAAVTALQMVPRALRIWVAPLGAAIAISGVFFVYQQTQDGAEKRATRSDIGRTAMVQAAIEAFQESPLIGHGSWFSNSDVYDNFFLIQIESARIAGVGGFAEANSEPGSVSLHSQILVALAEGGIFGAAFFLVYATGLGWGLWFIVFRRPWDRLAPLYTMSLLLAAWHLFLSPFSGAHRVYIAMATGLVLILVAESRASRRGEEAA